MKLQERLLTLARVLSQEEAAMSRVGKAFNNIIGFYCPKAGTGVTTLVANLGVLLAAQKKSCCILDLDLLFPTMQRFLIPLNKVSEMRSVQEKFLKPSMHSREIVNITAVEGLYLVSTKYTDSIVSFAELREDAVRSLFLELREMYDYVLVDLGGCDVAYESTTMAFDMCDYIYTVVVPQLDVVDAVVKMNNFLARTGFNSKLTRILQNKVMDKPYKPNDYKQFELNLLADLPYCEEVRQLGMRYGFAISSTSGNKFLKQYKHVCELLVKSMLQMSDKSNFTANRKIDAAATLEESTQMVEEHKAEEAAARSSAEVTPGAGIGAVPIAGPDEAASVLDLAKEMGAAVAPGVIATSSGDRVVAGMSHNEAGLSDYERQIREEYGDLDSLVQQTASSADVHGGFLGLFKKKNAPASLEESVSDQPLRSTSRSKSKGRVSVQKPVPIGAPQGPASQSGTLNQGVLQSSLSSMPEPSLSSTPPTPIPRPPQGSMPQQGKPLSGVSESTPNAVPPGRKRLEDVDWNKLGF